MNPPTPERGRQMNAPRPLANSGYSRLGVRRVVNAADTYTILGGSRLPREVVEAMSEAAEHHVEINELLKAIGLRIAKLTGTEAALVVNGAAAGLAVAAAACIAGTDPGEIDALPASSPARRQIITLRCQRNPYDRALLQGGGQLVEVGFADSTPPWQLERAIDENTAAIVYYAGIQFERYALPLEEVVRIAKPHSVPVIVDAAAQIPPVSNLSAYTGAGADLVLFSGGKGLRGPQSSGLIVGRRELIDACAANSYPNHSVGRAMKTNKESAMGLLAAIERAMGLDWDLEYGRWTSLLEGYAAVLGSIAGVRAWIVPTGRLGQTCPRLFFEWTREVAADAGTVLGTLAGQNPSVIIGADDPRSRTAYINPYSVLPDEEQYLIEAVSQVLQQGEFS